jgi:hypothetical protein
MIGLKLPSISGKTDITLSSVDADTISVRAQSGEKSRPTEELRRIVLKMDLGQPIHVDSVLFGSGSSRNQPETILANMPDVEWLNLNGRKHIVWVGKQTHELGTLKEIEEFEATQIRARFRGRGPLTGRRPTSVLVLAKDPRKASKLLAAALQVSAPEPLAGGQAYRISTDSSEILMFPTPEAEQAMEVIPVLQVVDKDEAINRMRMIAPDLTVTTVTAEAAFRIVRIPKSGAIALE